MQLFGFSIEKTKGGPVLRQVEVPVIEEAPVQEVKEAPIETPVATTEVKEAPIYQLGIGTVLPGTIDGKQIYRNFSTYYTMYRRNTDIRRAIYELGETAIKAGYELRRKNLTDYSKEKIVQNVDFARAMELSGGLHKIKKEIIRNLKTFSTVFILRKEKNVYGKVIKYEVLDTRNVTVITDSELKPVRYQYKNPKLPGKIFTYNPDQIIHHIDDSDLDNPLFGISILETIVPDVLGDDEAALSNYYFFGNDSIPSALYILEPGLSVDQQKQAEERIKNILSGGHNKHKNVISSHIKDVKPIKQEHTDMGFREQRTHTSVRVSVAMGVPRTILGYIEDVNHSNGESQYEKFIENTVRPLETTLGNIFNIMLKDFIDKYDTTYFFIIDEHINDFEKKSKLANDNIKTGLWTINEGREYIDYEPSDNELCNEHLVPTSSQLLDNLLSGGTQAPAEPIPPAA